MGSIRAPMPAVLAYVTTTGATPAREVGLTLKLEGYEHEGDTDEGFTGNQYETTAH